MIGYLEGKLVQLSPSHTYLDVNGVGYDIQLTLHTYDAISKLKQCRLYTHLQIREDAWNLYGFATEKERSAFQKLLSITGIGAATARILLSSITPDELNQIIWNGDSKPLERVKGIGAKTAQRIILELKGKLPENAKGEITDNTHNTKESDALNALIGLGISKAVSEAALAKVKKMENVDNMNVEEWIKIALKNL